MNCKEAKENIKIQDFLNNLTIQPARIYGRYLWYKSPLPYRKDHNPSFRVDTKTNWWYDAGTGETGNIIDLVMAMNVTNVAGALQILQKPGLSKPSFSFFDKQMNNQPRIEIKHVQPLQNRALIQYLEYRKISPGTAGKFVQEAYYNIRGKQYFSLAFKNDKGGYELRNKYFKGSSSPKAITTVPGTSNEVHIFEGFFNFLSALEHYRTTKPVWSCIVLNSVSNLETIINTLEQYKNINLYLDNDRAGELAAGTIKSRFKTVKDYSKIIYPDHNDFNEFICKKPKP